MISKEILAKLGDETDTQNTGQDSKQPDTSTKDLSDTKPSAPDISKQTMASVPNVGQPDKGEGAGTKSQASQQTPDTSQQTGESEIVKKAKEKLGLQTVVSKTPDYWKNKYEASSKEGREKARQFALLAEALKKFGVNPIIRDDKVEFTPDENYVTLNSTKLATEVTKSLTEEEKGLAVTDVDTLSRIIAERLLKLTARPVPTISKEDISISSNEATQIIDKVVKESDYSAYPEYVEYIDAILEDEKTPESFKKWMLQTPENYEFGLKLLYDRVDRFVSPLMNEYRQLQAQQQDKQKQSQEDISLASQGRGITPSVKGNIKDIPPDVAELLNARGKSYF